MEGQRPQQCQRSPLCTRPSICLEGVGLVYAAFHRIEPRGPDGQHPTTVEGGVLYLKRAVRPSSANGQFTQLANRRARPLRPF
ncbi:hypothetical protein Y032_0604g553 [Ancylostoma ceylanicum]|uniref:Uncharacterized protein n=1 Tax=Ancylostoma ceylanicum TaxID=53326 RepID=A0A016WNN7_9BILA|nr:hypothetical protein Y032_0604g553 [Ancylostoma ceylanicum]